MSEVIHIPLAGFDKGSAECIRLAKALENDSTIKCVSRMYCMDGADGVIALANALKKNTSLICLNLRGNAIVSDGIHDSPMSVIDMLICTSQLVNGEAPYRLDGLEALVDALHKNRSLKRLDLSGNFIDNTGAAILAEGIRNNSSLTHMDMSRNRIGPEGESSLAHALQDNYSLICLDGVSGVDHLLERNREIYRQKCRSVWAVLMIARFRMGESNIPPGVHPEIMCRVAKILYRLPPKPPQSEKRRKFIVE